MTRKPLPKVIRRSDVDLRLINAEPDIEVPAERNTAPREEFNVEPEILPPLASSRRQPLPVAPSYSQAQAEARLGEAFKIVERHKFYAGLGGLFPLPAVNVAGVTAAILRMVKLLSDLYEVPFERDKTRSVVIGIMGGAAPTGLGAVTSSTLAFIVPGAATFGIAVSSLTAAALTRKIGMSFVERFEKEAVG